MAVVNSKHLIEAKREIAIPFELRLQLADGDTVSMTIVEIFRLLPGKRIVARAKYKGGDVQAKIFLGKTAARYSEKDKSGINLIAAAGVRSPELLFEVVSYPHPRVPLWLPKRLALACAKIVEVATGKEVVKKLIIISTKG